MKPLLFHPSARAQFITRGRYNRPTDETEKTFESWPETVDRVVSHQRWLWERAQGLTLDDWQVEELDELRWLFLNRMVMPAGRTLWLGGTELVKRREASSFNPGRRSTRFITNHGVKSFEDFNDGDVVTVLTHNGNWREAVVSRVGTRPVNKITFCRGRSVQTEYFTPDHTWVLKNGDRTNELQAGDAIHAPPTTEWQYDEAPIDERVWWAYGFVYGDGTVVNKKGGSPTSMARLCGDKQQYLERFKELGFAFSFPPSCNNDPVVYTGHYLKTLPRDTDEPRLVRAFVEGYLAADGHKDSNYMARSGTNRYDAIQATAPEAQAFIETMFPAAGYYIINVREVTDETNFGKRSGLTKVYSIRNGFGESTNGSCYRVKKIEPQGEEEVWCLTVDDDHSFVLPNGVVTGNCSFLETRTIHDIVDAFWLLLQGCLPPDTPVLTEHGPTRIDQVRVGDRVWSYNCDTGTTELKPVVATHDVHVPRDENVRINCHYGRFVTSKKHPVLVRRGEGWRYVPAGSVKPGDIVRKAAFTGDADVDEDAWLAGAFVGDGASNATDTGGRRVRLTDDTREVVQAFADGLARVSGESCRVKEVGSPAYSVPMWAVEKTVAADNPLSRRWTELVGDLPTGKTFVVRVPAWVRRAYSRAVFFSFLAGLLDTDGSVGDVKASVATSSKPLVDDLLALCPLYGVYPWVTTVETDQYTGSGYRPTAPMYRVNFSIQDVAGCLPAMRHPAKRVRMEDYLTSGKVRRKKLIVPADQIPAELQYLGMEQDRNRYNYRYQVEDHETCASGWYVSRGKSYDHLLHYDQVLSVETDLDLPTAFKDLTVADNHSYLCGDGSYYVLHNCGVGFKPASGVLSGFVRRMEIEIVRSTKTREDGKGRENNVETYDARDKVWTIDVGDSAEAWAKSVGKLMAGKYPARKLRIVLSEIRAAGTRLKGYGWLSSGDASIANTFAEIGKIMNAYAGKLLPKVAIWDIINWLGTTLSSRRSAEIGLVDFGDPEWEAVATRKYRGFDDPGNPHWYRGQSNNTVAFQDRPNKKQLDGFFDLMIANGGSEPGMLNMRAARARAPWVRGLNPCLTGFSLVYTADGRQNVTIKQLADEGKDVPVFCVDTDNRLTVRMMRHPRLTGVRERIYKVTLDNGQSVRVTGNHKFRLRNGSYIEASRLQRGDSLAVLTRYTPIDCAGESMADKYISLAYQDGQYPAEHRLIAAFVAGREILDGEHVHHGDGNRLNNDPDNLGVVAAAEHLGNHSQAGNNPRYCGSTNDELIQHGRKLTKQLGRRFSTAEWHSYARTHGLPLSFSAWRVTSLGNIAAFAKRCSSLEGFERFTNIDPRTVRIYHAMLEAGFNAEIVDAKVLVSKICEVCKETFSVTHDRREQCVCSHSCSNRYRKVDREKQAASLRRYHQNKRSNLREEQLKIYLAVKSSLNREPDKKEWVAACKAANVSAEISRQSSPSVSWNALKEAASQFNHKVVDVTEDGVEDVYNGTVDDHHNFFVGGFDEGITEAGRRKLVWINNLQCGEILLPSYGLCNLSEIDLNKFRGDHTGLHRAAHLIARANYRQTCVNLRDGILQSAWHETNEYLRLCGVGLSGICTRDDMTAYDYRQLQLAATSAAYGMADELGMERPKNVTTVKPSGTMAKVCDSTEGAHRPPGRYIFNHVIYSRHDPNLARLVDAGYRVKDHPHDKSSVLVNLPFEYRNVSFGRRGDLDVNTETAVEQLDRYRFLQRNYNQQNTSLTVSYDPSEKKEVVKWIDRNWDDDFVAVSFLFRADPARTAEDLGYAYLPQEVVTRGEYEAYTAGLRAVDLDASGDGYMDNPADEECKTGACPTR